MATQLIEKYSRWDSFDVLENANRYPGPTGFLAYVAEKALERDVEKILPGILYRLHISGAIYVHKLPLSLYVPYCTGHDISRVLKKGLRTPTIDSKPAKHLDSFVDHVANFLITMQHYFTGAQALSAVELYAGPFIKYDNIDYKTLKQQVQRLVFNLNYPSRTGMQSPFTNLTLLLDASQRMLEYEAIHGGKEVGTLGEYVEEAKLFLKALSEILMEGDAFGKPFTFPIPTLMVTAKSIWEDPELFEVIFKTAAKRGSFYWLNTRVVDPNGAYAMCCRLSIRRDEFRFMNKGFRIFKQDIEEIREKRIKELEKQKFGGVWAIPDTTGSINVIDVNLPRLALEAKGEESKFWELYEQVLVIIAQGLMWFRRRYTTLLRNYLNVYSMIHEYLPEFPSSHFNTIGLIGLPESVAILMQNPKLWFEGSRSEWNEATKLMKKIVEYARDFARKLMKETSEPFNVEEVPGESAAAKLAVKDLQYYPELRKYLPDTEYPIYSNSIAPYYGALDMADRIWIESQVQTAFTGGVMMHLFLGEEPDPEALAKLTKRIISTNIVYWSYTPAVTYCPRCGRTYTGLYTECPKCGNTDVEVWSRIVGYYRPLKNWNPYRKHEFKLRRHYSSPQ